MKQTFDSAEITIRPAKMSDAKPINRYLESVLCESEWLISGPGENPMTWWRRRNWILLKQSRSLETCLIAEKDGEIVGMIECFTDFRKKVRHVTTLSMSVRRANRRQGIGRALLDHVIKWVHDHRILEKIELHVHAPNAGALSLYKSVGFMKEGTRQRAIRLLNGDYTDDIIMGLWP